MISKTHGVAQNPPGDSSITELCCQGRFLTVLLEWLWTDHTKTTNIWCGFTGQVSRHAAAKKTANYNYCRPLFIISSWQAIAHALLTFLGWTCLEGAVWSSVLPYWKLPLVWSSKHLPTSTACSFSAGICTIIKKMSKYTVCTNKNRFVYYTSIQRKWYTHEQVRQDSVQRSLQNSSAV